MKNKNDYATQRTRLLKARADRAELEAKQRAGELIERAEVTKQLIERELRIKRLFMTLPRAVSPQLSGKGVVEMEAVLTEHVYEILRELARGYKQITRNEEPPVQVKKGK